VAGNDVILCLAMSAGMQVSVFRGDCITFPGFPLQPLLLSGGKALVQKLEMIYSTENMGRLATLRRKLWAALGDLVKATFTRLPLPTLSG
jgi:hypothetical protein